MEEKPSLKNASGWSRYRLWKLFIKAFDRITVSGRKVTCLRGVGCSMCVQQLGVRSFIGENVKGQIPYRFVTLENTFRTHTVPIIPHCLFCGHSSWRMEGKDGTNLRLSLLCIINHDSSRESHHLIFSALLRPDALLFSDRYHLY